MLKSEVISGFNVLASKSGRQYQSRKGKMPSRNGWLLSS